MRFSTSSALTACLFLGAGVDAFWRMPCKSRSGLARLDPLVNYAEIGDHVHAIHGSNGFSSTADTNDLLAGDCTSCEVVQDKSAYWTPVPYFRKANGEFKLVQQVGGMLAYYLLEPKDAKLKAFPKGFEMLAGDTHRRNFSYPVPDVEKSAWTGDLQSQDFLREWALGFNCLNYGATPEAALNRHEMPEKSFLDQNCPQGVRLELMFPSCWDGKNLDGVNHDKKSHMAYPNLGNAGTCPEGFPVRMVSLFYETIWNTYEFKGEEGEFVFSNGDKTGNGYHGDFIMGWDEEFLQKAADNCKNESGEIGDCPFFTLQGEDKMDQCQIPEHKNTLLANVFKEKVDDNIYALPGNVPIIDGPGYAKGAAPAKPAGPAKQLIDKPASASTSKLPGAVLKESSAPTADATITSAADANIAVSTSALSTSQPLPPPPPTTTAPPAPPAALVADKSVSYFKTEYITKGREVIEVFWVEQIVTVTDSTTTTTTVLPRNNGAYKERKRHLFKHRRGLGGTA